MPSAIRLPVGAAAIAALLASPALAQPANDTCASPTSLAGFGSTPFDNTGATTDGLGNPVCLAFNRDQVLNDLWYCWTAAATEPTKVSLCGSTYDTRLAVYDGCTCPEGAGIMACNDDSACGTQSQLTFSAIAGHQYMIRVGSYDAAGFGSGSIQITSALPGVLGGPLVNPDNTHTYYILETSSWTAAEAKAVALGGHLATVRSAAENEWIRLNLANFGGVDRRVWIGLNDFASEGTFVWSSGDTSPFRNWSGGEPNDSAPGEDAVELFGSNGAWNDNRDTPASVIVYGAVEIIPAPACPADYDHNGSIEPADVAAFVNVWFTSLQNGTLAGDFDHNNAIEPADVAAFVNAWFTALTGGC